MQNAFYGVLTEPVAETGMALMTGNFQVGSSLLPLASLSLASPATHPVPRCVSGGWGGGDFISLETLSLSKVV